MARTLSEAFPPPAELLELETEEVAAILLDYLCELEEERAGRLNRYNFTLDDNIIRYTGEKNEEVSKAIMEAWCWLEKEGMLAPKIGESMSEWRYVTKKGFKLRNKPDLEKYRKAQLLPRENLDKNLFRKVYPLFLRGDYDTAVFQAFKEVEIRVRKKAKLPDSLWGTDLMRKAFNVANGPLTDKKALPAEKQATSDLFAGSIGMLKNPSSHREVDLSNPDEAAEIILFANYLLRIVDRCKQ